MSPFFTNDLTVKLGPDLPLYALRLLEGLSCLAHLVEQQTTNLWVLGSNPRTAAKAE